MIQFAIGITLLIAGLGWGGLNYFEKTNLIAEIQRSIDDSRQRESQAKQLEDQRNRLREQTIERGQDQRANLIRTLGLEAEPRLNFRITAEAPAADQVNKSFYHHTFELDGPMSFAAFVQMIDRLEKATGLTVTYSCFRCGAVSSNANAGANPGEYQAVIRGNIYVHNTNI